MNKRQIGGHIETTAVHAGERRPGPEGSVVFPIYQGTVYAVPPGTDYHDIRYLRLSSTPTQRYLHDKLAALEGAEDAIATSSGMAAISTTLLAFLRAGDHLIAGNCLYGGTHDFLTRHAADLGLSYTFVDTSLPQTWTAARRPNTRLFMLESISNPLMRVPPLREVAAFARREGFLSLVDNTFASPVNCRPLDLGIDISLHSATKYLNGHNDLVAGCVLGRHEHIESIRRTLNIFGGTIDAHTAFLLARGIKTLAIRVAAQNANAMALARFLAGHDAVAGVNYPGLESHPDHAIARQHLSGFGGMLSFRIAAGAEAAARFLTLLRLPAVAPSLGGVETLVTLPVLTSHAGMDPGDRRSIGIGDELVRVSCGIEHVDDLVGDFRQALERLGIGGVEIGSAGR